MIWQDFADIDIIRVGDTYYYSAPTMYYSPGAPILRSYDLNGARGYVKRDRVGGGPLLTVRP